MLFDNVRVDLPNVHPADMPLDHQIACKRFTIEVATNMLAAHDDYWMPSAANDGERATYQAAITRWQQLRAEAVQNLRALYEQAASQVSDWSDNRPDDDPRCPVCGDWERLHAEGCPRHPQFRGYHLEPADEAVLPW